MGAKPSYTELEQRIQELEKLVDKKETTVRALRNQKDFLDSVLDALWDTVYIFDAETGQAIRWNKVLEEVSGYDYREMGKYPPSKCYPPEEHQKIADILKEIETSGRATVELNYIIADGSTIPYEYSVVPVTGPEGQNWLCSIGRDLTQRKKAERALLQEKQQFEEYINSLPGLFYVFDTNNFLMWNTAWSEVTGYSSEELAKMYGPDFFEGVDKTTIEQRMLDVFNGTPSVAEAELVTKDGRRIPYLFTGVLKKRNGKSLLVGLGIDITERKQMEHRLLQAQKLEAIGVLAGGLAHDFNNILGVIGGNISYVLSILAGNTDISEALNDAQKGVKQARALTQQLITFAKGGEPITKIADLRKIIEEAASFVVRGTKTPCVFDFADDLWHAEVDGGQINQVITNLVLNASQAMPKGGAINVAVSNHLHKSDDSLPLAPGPYIRITVEDQGVGISGKHIDRIFDPYYSTKRTGKGLGLATTHSIISRHHGHISAESALDKGTTFNIFLPAVADTRKIESANVAANNVAHSGKGSILVMDDQAQVQRMLERILKSFGYSVAIANDGKEAIDIYRAALEEGNSFSLVVLDLTVPGGLGGAETLTELKKIDEKVKAVVSSGYSTDPVMANYEAYGFSGVLPKPYIKSQVGTLLDQVLRADD